MQNQIEIKFGNLSSKGALALINTYESFDGGNPSLQMTGKVQTTAADKPAKQAPAKTESKAEEIDLGDTVEKEITLEEIIAATQKFADKHSREAAGKVIASFGVKSVRDIPKEKFAAYLAKLNK